MEHGPGRVRMGTRRGTLSFIELPVDTGRRGYMICVPITIGCCSRDRHAVKIKKLNCSKLNNFAQFLEFFVFNLDRMPIPEY